MNGQECLDLLKENKSQSFDVIFWTSKCLLWMDLDYQNSQRVAIKGRDKHKQN